MSEPRFIANIPNSGGKISAQIEQPLHTRKIVITSIPQFPPDNPEAKTERPENGGFGEYEINYIFAIPGETQFFNDFTDLDRGNSQISLGGMTGLRIAMHPQNPQLSHGTPDYEFELLANPKGNLARAKITVTAQNFADADTLCHGLVTPMLSHLTFVCDCGLDICGRFLTEKATGSCRMISLMLGQTKTLSVPVGFVFAAPSVHIAPLAALYREAMNTINPFHQFLCFYKIIEGVYSLRPLRNQKAKASGADIRQPPGERFPDTLDEMALNEDDVPSFSTHLGKSFGFVRDQMRVIFRNAVAHMNVSTGSVSGDSLRDLDRCELAIPVVKFMARRLLENEMFLEQSQAN